MERCSGQGKIKRRGVFLLFFCASNLIPYECQRCENASAFAQRMSNWRTEGLTFALSDCLLVATAMSRRGSRWPAQPTQPVCLLEHWLSYVCWYGCLTICRRISLSLSLSICLTVSLLVCLPLTWWLLVDCPAACLRACLVTFLSFEEYYENTQCLCAHTDRRRRCRRRPHHHFCHFCVPRMQNLYTHSLI